MSNPTRILGITLALWSGAALGWQLDDCSLSDALHSETAGSTPEDAWSWMNHDLAVARDAMRTGERARALALVQDQDGILGTHLEAIIAVRGQARVRALHTALQDLSRGAGGWPLAELVGAPEGAKG
jgi:hypothetical protein